MRINLSADKKLKVIYADARRGDLKKRYRAHFIYFTILVLLIFSACRSHSNKGCVPAEHPTGSSAAADSPIPILLFDGTGTSPCDVVAIETILDNSHLDYSTTNSSQLNRMNESQIRKYRLLIFPGGNFIDMGNSLTKATATNIHNAVHDGLNYLGICAGGFLAGNSAYYNGFNLASGARFGFYSAEEKGIHKEAVPVAIAGGLIQDHYWEDGPQFTGWGLVVAKYPDGTPAIAEGAPGSGWVILTGIHAEAPESWQQGITFGTPAATDNEYAAALVRAALNRVSLPHY